MIKDLKAQQRQIEQLKAENSELRKSLDDVRGLLAQRNRAIQAAIAGLKSLAN